ALVLASLPRGVPARRSSPRIVSAASPTLPPRIAAPTAPRVAPPAPPPRALTPVSLPSLRVRNAPRAADPFPAISPPGGAKAILVSFDAGSSDRGAAEILDALRGRSIRTTIFLTGQFIRRYPGLTRRIAEDGHEVGNHTWDHPHLTTYASDGRQSTRAGVTEEMLRDELQRTAALYRETTGRDMAPLWRAPFGEENAEIRGWALAAGFAHVSWTHGDGRNLDALDWVSDPESPRYRSSERVISRLLASARPGNIILMHLGSDREDPVADHLPRLLDTLASEGYRFSTASELIASGKASH
ncbi:MAG TPA: polysaccharide deacetylase family protein, partial [Thermoanaerobaculia bacterium]|nr:polysaccharide deacetylase family protein [Thermoanaerobaculia bacterium]